MAALPDDARLYTILDTGYVPRDRWLDTARALIAGGADLVQVRAKNASALERESLVQEILPLFTRSRTDGQLRPWLVVNDDVELCAQTPGTGLHLGQDDMRPDEARRRIGPERILGWSTHSWAQAAAAMAFPAGVLSYFCVGPLFATPTKPDYTPVGLNLAGQVAASCPALPWFVIGGITRSNLAQPLARGARRVVVVSEILRAADPAAVARAFREALTRG